MTVEGHEGFEPGYLCY